MEGLNREKTLIIKEDPKTTKDVRIGVGHYVCLGVHKKHFFVDTICTFIYNLFVTILLSISCSMFVRGLTGEKSAKFWRFAFYKRAEG